MDLLRRPAFWLTVAMLAAGTLAGFLAYTLLSYGPSSPAYVGGPLLVSDRDGLYVCVDEATPQAGEAVSAAKERLQDWFGNEISAHPGYDGLGYGDLRVRIDEGCPFEPYLVREGAEHPALGGVGGMADRFGQRPGRYRFAVFVADESLIREKFAGLDSRRTPEEFLCENHECNEVTTSIYVSEREINGGDGRFFLREFLRMMGLD